VMTEFASRRILWFVAMTWMAVSPTAFSRTVYGQDTSTSTPTPTPTFDVVSIRPGDANSTMRRIHITPDRYAATGTSLKGMIQQAYDLKMEDQISGVTGWADSARFDVEAKVDEKDVEALKKLPPEQRQQQQRLMMQAMLADRFKLRVHHERKELPMYALVVAKGGSKLKQADPNDTYANGIKGPDGVAHAGMMRSSNNSMTAQGIPTGNLALSLSGQVQRMVVDKTGLTGTYDFELHWSPEELHGDSPSDGASTQGPSIFTALEEQLGLKLESTKGPVDTIVVDHVEMPSAN